jgi:Tfp pilus assembly protein PilX
MNMRTLHRQRGTAALAVALVLLFATTVVAFFANRTMIFEQRTSANQLRSTKAFELADAGLEWAIARLNDSLVLTANSCTPASGTGLVSFGDRYAQPRPADATHPTGYFNAVSTAMPGCQIDPSSGALSCGCPSANAATLATAAWPRFRVQFNIVPSDPSSLEIVSRGCTNGDPCDPSQAVSAGTDSTAVARVLVKVVPTFPGGGPKAGLISGSTTVVSGSLNVVNTDTRSNGITINTGSFVDLSGNGVSVVSLPGTPAAASILDNDPSLLQLTNADANGELFFKSFVNTGFSDFQTSPLTKFINGRAGQRFNSTTSPLSCNGGNDCARAVSYWIDRGITQFWVDLNTSGADSSIDFTNGTLPSTTPNNTIGTEAKAIVLATQGQLSTSGGVTAYGVFYAASATAVDDLTLSGGGNSTIYGSLITRGDFARTGNGNITIVPRTSLFSDPGPPKGLLLPVPGSWRDKASPY